MSVVIAVIVFDYTDIGHLLIKLLEPCRLIALMHFEKLLESVILAQLHLAAQLAHFGRENLLKSPILGRVRAEAGYLMYDHVRDFLAELDVALVNVLLALILAYDFFVFTLLRHCNFSLRLRLFL